MKIWIIDEQTREIVLGMIDVALRGGGIKNLGPANHVLEKLGEAKGRELALPEAKPEPDNDSPISESENEGLGEPHCAGAIQ